MNPNPSIQPIAYTPPTQTSGNLDAANQLASAEKSQQVQGTTSLQPYMSTYASQIAQARANGYSDSQIYGYLQGLPTNPTDNTQNPGAGSNAPEPTVSPTSPTPAISSTQQPTAPTTPTGPVEQTTFGVNTGKLAQYTPGGQLALGAAQKIGAAEYGNQAVASTNKAFNDQITSLDKDIARQTDPAKIARLQSIMKGVYETYGYAPPANLNAVPTYGGERSAAQTISGTGKPLTAADIADTSNNGVAITNRQMVGSGVQLLATLGTGGLAEAAGVGTIANPLVRGAATGLIAGVGQGAGQAIGNAKNADEALRDVGVGAATGFGGGAILGGAAGALGSAAENVSNYSANRALQPLTELSESQSAKLAAADTGKAMLNYGVKPIDYGKVSDVVGSKLVSTVNEAASKVDVPLFNSGTEGDTTIPIGDIKSKILNGPGTSAIKGTPLARNISNEMQNMINDMSSSGEHNPAGIPNSANGLEVLQAQRGAAAQANQFLNNPNASVADKQAGRAWQMFSDELKQRLDDAGTNEAAQEALHNNLPDITKAAQNAGLNKNFTKDLTSINSSNTAFRDLRSLDGKFVKSDQINSILDKKAQSIPVTKTPLQKIGGFIKSPAGLVGEAAGAFALLKKLGGG